MLLSDFNFELPPDLIAQQPLPQRDASRMLTLDRKRLSWEDSSFRSLPDLLSGDELIVVKKARGRAGRVRRGRTFRRSDQPRRLWLATNPTDGTGRHHAGDRTPRPRSL